MNITDKDRNTWRKEIECRHRQTALLPTRLYPSYPAPTKDITTLVEQCTQCGKYLNYFCKPISPGWDKAWSRYKQQSKL